MSGAAGKSSSQLDASSAIPLAGIALYVLTSVIYVFPPGLPQPADFILLLVAGLTLSFSWRYLADEPILYIAFVSLLGWIITVNSIWFLMEHDFRFLQSSLFFIFNAIVFISVLGIALRDFDRFCCLMYWSCIAALAVEVFYITIFYPGLSRRTAGSFNNPNQLGYWVLLVFACIGVVRRRERLGLVDLFGLGLGCYAIALSLSRAATIAAGVLVTAIVISSGVRRGAGLVLAAGLAGGLAFEILNGGGGMVDRIANAELTTALDQRLSGISEAHQDGDMVRRGYKRLVDNPHYLALGAGEGAYERLSTENFTKEFHSTLGNVLMSYGIVGLTLFGLFLFAIFKNSPWTSWMYLFSIMLYGITHMGLRDSLFWIFLALVCAHGRRLKLQTIGSTASGSPYGRSLAAYVRHDAALRGKVG